MIRRFVIHLLMLLLAALVLTSNADARPRHHRHHIPDIGKMDSNLQGFVAGCPIPIFGSCGVAQSRNYRQRRIPPGLHRVMVEGAGRVVGHPPGCPARAFCGCGASVERFGRSIRSLWLAANWLKFPRAEPAPGRAAVRRDRHHVVILRQHVRGSIWIVYDANSGRHRTRIHPRSIAGWAIVDPRANS